MPALGTYQKLVIKGSYGTSEIWQTGFYLADTSPPATQSDLQALLALIEPMVATWWAAIKAAVATNAAYTGCRMYQYQDPNTHAEFAAAVDRTPVPGTLSSTSSPADTALVVSVRSTLPGRSGRNRMYVPCHASCLPATGMIGSTTSDNYGTQMKALWAAISAGTSAVPIVVSRTLHEYNVPTQLVTDDKPDVQRRRENRLLADHVQTLAWP